MKKIGLIGGMSWQSTMLYYRGLNEAVAARLGGLHSARVLVDSIDFDALVRWQREEDWARAGDLMVESARNLERGGAACVLITANTMHLVFDRVADAVSIPLLHIVDATGARLVADGVQRVALLGTRFTMEKPFFRDRLRERFGIATDVPQPHERDLVHRVIYDELCRGQIDDASRRAFLDVIHRMADAGAQAAIEGCTEITLLVQPQHTAVPLYDTTALHVAAAVDFALSDA